MLGKPSEYTFWQLLCLSCISGDKTKKISASPEVVSELTLRGLNSDNIEELRDFVFKAQDWLNAVVKEIEFFANARMAVGDEEDLALAVSKAYERNEIDDSEAKVLVDLLNQHMESYLEKFDLSDVLNPEIPNLAEEGENVDKVKRWWQFWK